MSKEIEVAAAIIYNTEKILIAKRASHKSLGGFWEFPGGKIEKGENAEDCLKRELQEEMDIEIEVRSFFAEHVHDYQWFRIRLKAYICQFISGNITLVDHDEVLWVSFSELNNYNLAPADIPIANLLIDSNLPDYNKLS